MTNLKKAKEIFNRLIECDQGLLSYEVFLVTAIALARRGKEEYDPQRINAFDPKCYPEIRDLFEVAFEIAKHPSVIERANRIMEETSHTYSFVERLELE